MPGDGCELELSSGLYISFRDYLKNSEAREFYSLLKDKVTLRVKGPTLSDLVGEKVLKILDIQSVYEQLTEKDPELKKTNLWAHLDSHIRPKLNSTLSNFSRYEPFFDLQKGAYTLESDVRGLFETSDAIDSNQGLIPTLAPELHKVAAQLQKLFASKSFEDEVNGLKKGEKNFKAFQIGESLTHPASSAELAEEQKAKIIKQLEDKNVKLSAQVDQYKNQVAQLEFKLMKLEQEARLGRLPLHSESQEVFKSIPQEPMKEAPDFSRSKRSKRKSTASGPDTELEKQSPSPSAGT